jgi:uncharacterized protein involved in exopolysaccharide biosynthesis
MSYHDLLNIIIFHRKAILKITVFSVIFIFLILFFIYPVSYKSSVSVLPPEKNNNIGGLSGLLASQDLSGMLTGGMLNANSQLYAEILKSRSASLYVVRKHNLLKYYDAKNEIDAARELSEDLEIEINKEGILRLNVEVKTNLFPFFSDNKHYRELSAKISNSFVEALDLINRDKLSSKAKRARVYIEEQLLKTKTQLDSVENSLMEFQKRNKTVALSEQLSAAIDAAASLKAEIVKTEVELGLVEPNLREDNKTLIALRSKLDELRSQYSKLEMGNQDYLLAFKEVPELGRELASLLREVKIQNEVYLLLQQQYYKEKIQENRDLPTVEVLDEAIPPLKASGPRVIFYSVLGGVFIFLLTSLFFAAGDRNIYLVKDKEKGTIV